MKEIDLPSGAKLKIGDSPFEDSKALYQAVLDEAKAIKIDMNSAENMSNVYKDLFLIGFSSKKIEAALWKCFEKCIYEDGRGSLKIDKDTFQPKTSREDYVAVCMGVAKENIDPFVKGLYAEYSRFFQAILSDPQ